MALLLSLVLAFGCMPALAWADGGADEESSYVYTTGDAEDTSGAENEIEAGETTDSADTGNSTTSPNEDEAPGNSVVPGAPDATNPEDSDASSQPEGLAPAISGVDFLQPASKNWEVLRVRNLGEQTLYLDIARLTPDGGMESLLKRGAYTSKAEEGIGLGEEVAQIITLDLAQATAADALGNAAAHDVYRVSVYTERRGGVLLYEGVVYPIYAELRDGEEVVSYELLGIRTASAEELASPKSVGAGEVFYKESAGADGVAVLDTFVRVDNDSAGNVDNYFDETLSAFLVPFEKQADQALAGSIRYVDEAGDLVKETFVRDFVDGVAQVRIEDSFLKADNENPEITRYYRAISNLAGSTVTLTAANAHVVVRVAEIESMTESDYAVTVRYIDENDRLLWSDTVDVKGYGYQYTLPTTFSMLESDGVELYTLRTVESGQTEEISPAPENPEASETPGSPEAPEAPENPETPEVSNGELESLEADGESGDSEGDVSVAQAHQSLGRDWGIPTIKFDTTIDPERDFLVDSEGKYYVNACYSSSTYDGVATLTLVAIDGSTGERLPEICQPALLEISPEQPASFTPQALEVDGVSYVPWSGNTEPISYAWDDLAQGVDLLQYIYYVPEGYTPEQVYDVTVQYVNIANNAVLRTDTHSISPELSGYMTLMSEEQFIADGNEYVRLAGQERGIRHGYYSPGRLYTVYYRDIHDTINADVVIQRTQIIETERVVTVPGETITTTTTVPGSFTTITAAPVTLPTVVTTAPTGETVVADAPASAGEVDTVEGATGEENAAVPTPTSTDANPAPTVTETGVAQGEGSTIINDDENPLANQAGQSTTTERTIADDEIPLANIASVNAPGDVVDPFNHGSRNSAMIIVSVAGAVVAAIAGWLLLRRSRRKSQIDFSGSDQADL